MSGRQFIAGMAILSAALLLAVGLWIYSSPYQTCLRSEHAVKLAGARIAMYCADVVNGR